jgi:hypothetical protein
VLCPLNGSEWTIDTPAVEKQIARAAAAANVNHVYIATIWPPQVQFEKKEEDPIL